MASIAKESAEPKAKPNLVRRSYQWVMDWADTKYAVTVLGLLAFAEASIFPIPPDVLLIPMCIKSKHKALRYAALCTCASVLGGVLGYVIGAWVWGAVAPWFYRYIPGFSPAGFAKVQDLYISYGIAVVFTAGLTPIPYKLFTIVSGVMGLSVVPFLLASIVGRGARFFAVGILLRSFGEPIVKLIDRYFNIMIVVFAVIFIFGFVVVRWVL